MGFEILPGTGGNSPYPVFSGNILTGIKDLKEQG
jgi:hypothetical protein